ncbi:MAG: hypothetical protein IJT51_06380, partial [Bacteroidales bacterium]|nr:hypothetical protein [Bacteroidales bacterium]
MKKVLFLFFVLISAGLVSAYAQAPLNEQLPYQAVLRNAQNQLVYNQSNITVTVYVLDLNATVVRYSETHTGLSTNANGLLTLMVGAGTLASGSWQYIIWSDASIKMRISYDPGTGPVVIETGPHPVNAVPFALTTDCNSVINCVDDAIGDGGSPTNLAIDTIIDNHLAPYEIKNCDDVNNCVTTAIADGNSVINQAIDTVVLNNVSSAIADGNSDINQAIDTVVINNVSSAIADGNSDINQAIDTVVINNVSSAIADGNSDINQAIDTVVINNVSTAIADGNSDVNHAIDTVVLNNM